MKTILTTFLLFFTFQIFSQGGFHILSPGNIAGSYNIGAATNWGADLNAVSVTGDLVIVDDGTAADSLGCNSPLINSGALNGNIAFIYRGVCEFGSKALYAENAGAVGAIIVGNQPGPAIDMAAGNDGGLVNIPVVYISQSDGQQIRNEMDLGAVVGYLGNLFGLYDDDIGISNSTVNRARSFSMPQFIANNNTNFEFTPTAYVVNYGNNDQTDVVLNAEISVDGTTIYNQSSAPQVINSGDTLLISLPDFSQVSYDSGYYDVSYNVSGSYVDENTINDQVVNHFYVNDKYYSKSEFDQQGDPTADVYYAPANFTGSFQSCIVINEQNADSLPLGKIGFSAANYNSALTGALIDMSIYEWSDNFIDPNNATFNNINLLTNDSYIYPSDLQEEFVEVEVNGGQGIYLSNNQKYLACITTYTSDIHFGFSDVDYTTANIVDGEWYSPLNSGSTWFVAGFGLDVITAIYLDMDIPCYVTADVTYSQTTICNQDAPITPNFNGTTGGTYSSSAGLDLDVNTGEIDPQSSALGNYEVIYFVDDNGCTGGDTVNISIIDFENASFSYSPQDFCESNTSAFPNITGVQGGDFSADAGLDIDPSTGEINPSNSPLGNYTVYYTSSNSNCANTDSFEVVIEEDYDATFEYSTSTTCVNYDNLSPTIIGDMGGTFNSGVGLNIDVNSGIINPGQSDPGSYVVVYSVGQGVCQATETFTIYIDACLGMDDNSIGSLNIYPNPTDEIINIDASKIEAKWSVSIFDSSGKLVIDKFLNGNLQLHQINVSDLEIGVYTILLKNNRQFISKSIVISR